ncbi:hypothetical protein [Prauserella muralis]|uniref:Uncharacterized protein n=1 Tax=Prauserella muralis TaxID=588067 RepID=A0A2V4AQ92_9PSEU|nr:hypothetical protein [Prauserella muralis]PXY22793.1 hypothetical protein BAY60_23695 [Prauserella muralis]TWE28539.1 hypothetical protein FHX69_1196 [Prauserella muralis]
MTAALLGSLAATLVLALLHVAAPHLRGLPGVPERATGSFAGGLAVAYVFVHLLPELAQGNEAIGEALSDVIEPTPLFELAVFVVALAGFAVFYGLERLAVRGRGPDHAEPSAWVYRVHLGAFAGYNFLITYTMELRVRTGLLFAALFVVAMGLHFVLTDRSLRAHYPRRFARRGRYVLAAALVLGWAVSAVLAPTSVLLVSLLTALLSGSVLLNVFKEELPDTGRSSFGWFLTGLTCYAGLLALATAFGG